jgi:hypothetical protein
MSDWGVDYKYKNSGYSRVDNTRTLKEVLLFILVLAAMTTVWAVVTLFRHMAAAYGWFPVLGWTALGIGVIIIILLSILALDRWASGAYMDYKAPTGGMAGGGYTPPVKQSIIGKVVAKSSILLPGERTRPPRAVFFGKLDGQSVEQVGPMEEKWLNEYELRHWNKQKEQNLSPAGEILNKTADNGLPVPNTATKIVK